MMRQFPDSEIESYYARSDVVPDEVIDLSTMQRSPYPHGTHTCVTYDETCIAPEYSPHEYSAHANATYPPGMLIPNSPDQSPYGYRNGDGQPNDIYHHDQRFALNSFHASWPEHHHMQFPVRESRDDRRYTHNHAFCANSHNPSWQRNQFSPDTELEYHGDHLANDTAFFTDLANATFGEDIRHVPETEPEGRDDCGDCRDDCPFPPVKYVAEYHERDILCGRGALMIWHPGNQFFRRLVQQHRQRYFFSRRQEKKNIASQIINEIKAHGGRFLRRSTATDGVNQINVWVEIEDERAYQKTCQALREGAPEIRKKWRSKPSGGKSSRLPDMPATPVKSDDAASK